jgi:Na+/H+-dicarboxylate symporter
MTHPIERIHLSSLRRLSGSLHRLVDRRLWARVLIGMGLGAAVGVALGPSVGWAPPRVASPLVSWLALPGMLFLALIQMIVIPLVFASVVRGLAASENVAQLRAVGIGAATYFLLTTALATGLGLLLGLAIRPGRFIDAAAVKDVLAAPAPAPVSADAAPSLTDLPAVAIGLLPTNPLASMVGGQMLQVILFAVVFGVALVNVPAEKSAPLFDILGSLQEVCMKVVAGAMRLAPLAVFGLVARMTSTVGVEVLAGMGIYMATVLAGLALLLAGYVLLALLVAGQRAGAFLSAIRELALLAFSTSSSAAVMPLSIQVAEDRLGVRPSIARFVVPLGATVNMNGTALYQGVATVFLAQIFGVTLGTWGLLIVVVTAVAASVGSPATPGMGIVILAMVLEGAGVPVAGIALLMGVDRLLDMCRTAVNVTGDLTACVVLNRWTAEVAPAAAAVAAGGR